MRREWDSAIATKMQMDEAVAQGNDAFTQMTSAPSLLPQQTIPGIPTTVSSNTQTIASTWGHLLENIKILTEVVDKISEVQYRIDQHAIL